MSQAASIRPFEGSRPPLVLKSGQPCAERSRMAEFPAPSKHARMLQATGNGLQEGEHVFTAVSFHRNRVLACNGFAVAGRFVANAVRKTMDHSPRAAPLMASRVGQYPDGLLAITNLHLLLYLRRGLFGGYRAQEAFWVTELRSITPAKARLAHPIAIAFADGSTCELDVVTAQARTHLFEVLDALSATGSDDRRRRSTAQAPSSMQ